MILVTGRRHSVQHECLWEIPPTGSLNGACPNWSQVLTGYFYYLHLVYILLFFLLDALHYVVNCCHGKRRTPVESDTLAKGDWHLWELTLPFKPQYTHTNSPNWSLYFLLRNMLREFGKRSRHFLFGQPFINSHNLVSWQCMDISRRKLMLVLKGLKCLRRGASRKRNLMEIIYSLTIIKVLSGIGLVAKLEQCVRYKIR